MITKNMVETYFGEIGYSTEKSFPGIKVLFHATKTGVKAVVIADAFVAGIYKKSDIRCLKKETKKYIEARHASKYLFIIIEDKVPACRLKDTVLISPEYGKIIKGGCKSCFGKELFILNKMGKLQRAESRKNHVRVTESDMIFLYIIIGINVYLYLKFMFSGQNYGIAADTLQKGKYQNLVTYMFFHAGIRHLIGNMVALLYLGRQLINKKGSLCFVAVYFLGGIGAGYFSIAAKMAAGAATETIGASGAVFAILGALLATAFLDNESDIRKSAALRYTLVTFVCSMGIKTDNICHIGGIICGFMVYALLLTIHNLFEIQNNRKFKEMRKELSLCTRNY